MDLRTYRAKSLAEALRLVREDLGPDASVLHTRQVGGGMWHWLVGGPQIEVTASSELQAPALLADDGPFPRADLYDFRSQFREQLLHDHGPPSACLEDLIPRPRQVAEDGLPTLVDRIGSRLIRQHVDADIVRGIVEVLHDAAITGRLRGWGQLCQQLLHLLAGRLAIRGPIRLLPGQRRVVALVGPTGVGKTTTLAKLAANFHVREGKQVGLVTVDTYRVAAAEQLQTYAQIMDLPMEVVSTPRQMRETLVRLKDMDLVLVDTAGCSPRDASQIDELNHLIAEADADETHLVLSSAAAPDSLQADAEAFASIGASAVILTKIDEVSMLGSLLPLLCNPRLPLSYVTDGQNVPYDIRPADRQRLSELIVGEALADAARN